MAPSSNVGINPFLLLYQINPRARRNILSKRRKRRRNQVQKALVLLMGARDPGGGETRDKYPHVIIP